jgi:hypothetical protein
MVYVFVAALIILIIYAIVSASSRGRYANMTEEEFEAEARRSSRLGAAVSGFQKIVDPGHRVEYVQQQNERVEADGAESGDDPDTGKPQSSKADTKS